MKLSVSSVVLVFALTLGIFSVASTAQAAGRGGGFGLGVILGEPSALSAKLEVSERTEYDAGIAFNFDQWVLIYGDWHYRFPTAFDGTALAHVVPYIGAGPVIVVSNRSEYDTRGLKYFSTSSSGRFALGLRVPFGLEWRPEQAPIGVFIEIAPGLTVVPGTYSFIEGGLGIRFYF